MKLFVAEGYYDLATPPATVDYSVNHMRLPTELQPNVTVQLYEGGHMMYVYEPSMEQLRKDLVEFYESALAAKPADEGEDGGLSLPQRHRGHGEELDRIYRIDWIEAMMDRSSRSIDCNPVNPVDPV